MVADCDPALYWGKAADYTSNFCGAKSSSRPAIAIIFFVSFTIFVGGLLFELITAIVLDEFAKMNEAEKLPVNGDTISNFNDHWAQLDPKATQMIPQHKLLPFLKSIQPPVFNSDEEARTEIFKMNIAATEGPQGLCVHYVDTLVAVVRYLYVKKLGEEVGADLDVTMIESPELTARIVRAYPHLKKIEKMEAKEFKTELAATKMQGLWKRRAAKKRIAGKRKNMEVELATRRGSQNGKVPKDISALSGEELSAALRDSGVGVEQV